ncbi:DUF2079 domain-containing protein [Aeromicrobium terrae]|uniref:DUF2079 domain-containing protein n=1 Tax=Aeromicrobium terrae TaxID=2498846 RepID=A0A5C8NHY9_9ACTN|nr:DUF2079 domain-containing protein [Aeromicrobium terrae]TXL61504.1 DUF2079 domain-containing protein [Aeromicrobium terrae]
MSVDRRQAVAASWAVLCGAAYALLTLRRFARFEPTSYDNAIFEQVVRAYAHLQAPVADIKGFTILGDHFSPVTALLAPFYRVFPHAQTLLVAQVVLVAISIHVVSALALRVLGWWAGAPIALAYGVSFGVQSAIKADFHEVAFAAPLLALAGAAYVDRRFDRVVLWSLPLLLVKEDLGLTVAVIGGVLWLAGERRRAAWLAATGLVGLLLVVVVIVPAFNPGGSYAYASSVGGDRGVLETAFDDPGRKLETLFMTFAVSGLAALVSPWALLVLPTFGWRFLGDNPYYWGTDFHYSLILMPIVAVAAVDAMARWHRLRPLGAVALVFTAVTFAGSPLTTLADRDTYELPPHAVAAQRMIDQIPAGKSVETDISVITHLVSDHDVTWLGTPGNARPDWLLFDVTAGIGSPDDVADYASRRYGVPYEVVDTDDGFVLARRNR